MTAVIRIDVDKLHELKQVFDGLEMLFKNWTQATGQKLRVEITLEGHA